MWCRGSLERSTQDVAELNPDFVVACLVLSRPALADVSQSRALEMTVSNAQCRWRCGSPLPLWSCSKMCLLNKAAHPRKWVTQELASDIFKLKNQPTPARQQCANSQQCDSRWHKETDVLDHGSSSRRRCASVLIM